MILLHHRGVSLNHNLHAHNSLYRLWKECNNIVLAYQRHTEVICKLLCSVFQGKFHSLFFVCFVLCFWYAYIVWKWGGNIYEVMYRWSHALVTPQECSLCINFPLSPEKKVSVNLQSMPWYSVFNNRFCFYCPVQRLHPRFRDRRNHRALHFFVLFLMPNWVQVHYFLLAN